MEGNPGDKEESSRNEEGDLFKPRKSLTRSPSKIQEEDNNCEEVATA